jgi:methionyl-tRNA formyltransferase
LELPGLLALNVHAASPDYPGRDPHHFAVYDGAKKYGATVHFMTSKVDSGPIVEVELFDVPAEATPASLLDQANQAAWVLLERLLEKLAGKKAITPLGEPHWGTRKTTRKMFMDLCRVDASMNAAEFERRLRATTMPGYNNLCFELHGYRFRLEGKS